MADFSGAEPRVGEIRAVRSFRVGPGGVLFPLFGRRAWQAGANEAVCTAASAEDHPAPDPDCTCGFYAYADERSAREYPFARHVLAVVACWGRVIAGTRGIRAQHARVEAVWFSPQVPDDLVAMVRDRYPGVAVHGDRAEMLAAHPPTPLESYETVQDAAGPSRGVGRALAAVALVAGCLPGSWIGRVPYGWWLWAAIVAALLITAASRGRSRTDALRRRRRLVCVALALWMVAPLAGATGVLLLRLPLVQLAALFTAQRCALDRMARTFPATI